MYWKQFRLKSSDAVHLNNIIITQNGQGRDRFQASQKFQNALHHCTIISPCITSSSFVDSRSVIPARRTPLRSWTPPTTGIGTRSRWRSYARRPAACNRRWAPESGSPSPSSRCCSSAMPAPRCRSRSRSALRTHEAQGRGARRRQCGRWWGLVWGRGLPDLPPFASAAGWRLPPRIRCRSTELREKEQVGGRMENGGRPGTVSVWSVFPARHPLQFGLPTGLGSDLDRAGPGA